MDLCNSHKSIEVKVLTARIISNFTSYYIMLIIKLHVFENKINKFLVVLAIMDPHGPGAFSKGRLR